MPALLNDIFVPTSVDHRSDDDASLTFFRTNSGALACLVADSLFFGAASSGVFEVFTVYRPSPYRDWNMVTSKDGYRYKVMPDEAAMRTEINALASHLREKAAVGRAKFSGANIGSQEDLTANTPWGQAQTAERYAPGVVSYTTAGHGGFLLSTEMNSAVHESLRQDGGAYEEDCAWAIVAFTFPELFTKRELAFMRSTMMDTFPDEFTAITGQAVTEVESYTLRQRAFFEAHKNDFIVTSALTSEHHEGQVEVYARRGGWENVSGEERRFLVPDTEYKTSSIGFVIDEARHPINSGPFSF